MKTFLGQSGSFKLSNFSNLQEIELLEGIKVKLIDDTYSSEIINFILNKDSFLDYQIKILNDDLEKEIKFILIGPGASLKAKCIYEGFEAKVCKLKTLQHHIASNTVSHLEIKTVLHNNSRLFCDSIIKIEPSVQDVSAYEQNKNFLLGDDARVITIPKLEVAAKNVSIRHGAAISYLDAEQIFYLQSRGLSFEVAKKVLIDAFLN